MATAHKRRTNVSDALAHDGYPENWLCEPLCNSGSSVQAGSFEDKLIQLVIASAFSSVISTRYVSMYVYFVQNLKFSKMVS